MPGPKKPKQPGWSMLTEAQRLNKEKIKKHSNPKERDPIVVAEEKLALERGRRRREIENMRDEDDRQAACAEVWD